MSRCLVFPFAVVVAVGLGAGALAQKPASQPASRPAPATPGRFQVSPSGNSSILVDTQSGQTWRLLLSIDPNGRVYTVWVPVRRLDNEVEVQKWLDEQEKLGRVLGK